jgi:hypothetical protein
LQKRNSNSALGGTAGKSDIGWHRRVCSEQESLSEPVMTDSWCRGEEKRQWRRYPIGERRGENKAAILSIFRWSFHVEQRDEIPTLNCWSRDILYFWFPRSNRKTCVSRENSREIVSGTETESRTHAASARRAGKRTKL